MSVTSRKWRGEREERFPYPGFGIPFHLLRYHYLPHQTSRPRDTTPASLRTSSCTFLAPESAAQRPPSHSLPRAYKIPILSWNSCEEAMSLRPVPTARCPRWILRWDHREEPGRRCCCLVYHLGGRCEPMSEGRQLEGGAGASRRRSLPAVKKCY